MQLYIIFPNQESLSGPDSDKPTNDYQKEPVAEVRIVVPKYVEVTPTITDEQVSYCFRFMQRYTYMESLPLRSEQHIDIYKWFMARMKNSKGHEEHENWEYMKDQFVARKKDFGSLYLNLDNQNQLLLIKSFDFLPRELQQELDRYQTILDGDDIVAAHFDPAPVCMQLMHNMVLFFNNHSIDFHVTDEIEFTNIPSRKPSDNYDIGKCFGNSSNWGLHLIAYKAAHAEYSTGFDEAFRGILSHYKIRIKE